MATTLTLGTLRVILTADSASFKRELGGAQDQTKGFGLSMDKLVGGAAVAAFALATKAVIDFVNTSNAEFKAFDQSIKEVFSIMPGASAEAKEQMTSDILDLGVEVGRLTDETVPALYQALSSGVPADNVLTFMQDASVAAQGGVTDLETVVDGLTSVINAYGADVIDAKEASDLMFQAVVFGKTEFSELSRYLYEVIPTASSLGIAFGDVTAGLAAITAQGTPTRVATSQLRQLFVELSKDGGETADTFERIAGKSFVDFIAQGGNVQSALQLMEQAAADSGVRLADLFSSIEAANAAMQLTGKGSVAFTSALAQMETSEGATQRAADVMNETLAHQEQVTAAAKEEFQILVGQALQPTQKAYLDLQQTIFETGSHYLKQVAIADAVRASLMPLAGAIELTGEEYRGFNDEQALTATLNAAVTTETWLLGDAQIDLARQTDRLQLATLLLEGGFKGTGEELQELINKFERVDEAARPQVLEKWAVAAEKARIAQAQTNDELDIAELYTLNYGRAVDLAGLAVDSLVPDIETETGVLRGQVPVLRDNLIEHQRWAAGVAYANMLAERYAYNVGPAFTDALFDTGVAAGSSGAAIKSEADILAELNSQLNGYFLSALDAEEQTDNWLDVLFRSAAQTGIATDELALLAAATGKYTEEQIQAALKSAAMQHAVDEVAAALFDGRATTEEAIAAIAGFQAQVDAGGDLDFKLGEFGIEEAAEALSNVGGAAGGASPRVQTLGEKMLKAAENAGANAEELYNLAIATGEFSDAQALSALKASLQEEAYQKVAEAFAANDLTAGEAKEALDIFDEKLGDTQSAEDALQAIHDLNVELGLIPRDVRVNVHTEYTSSGTPPQYGGAPPPPGSGPQQDQYGGPVEAGNYYVVGDPGPRSELFVPWASGYVVPHSMTMDFLENRFNTNGTAGPTYVLNVYTSAPTEPIIQDYYTMQALAGAQL